MRALIVDDEPVGRDCIRLALAGMHDVEIAGECRDGPEAVAAILDMPLDLVFLDIAMPGLDGFEIIERVGVDRMPPVLFITAYDDYAARAFELHALDYVLKPFTDARFRDAVRHARLRLATDPAGTQPDRLTALLQARGADGRLAERYVSRIAVRANGSVRFVPVEQVDYFDASGNYVRLHVGTAVFSVRSTLVDLVNRLDPASFVRIHRSTIVNLAGVTEIQPWFGGDHLAILADGRKLRVSRTYRDDLLRTFR